MLESAFPGLNLDLDTAIEDVILILQHKIGLSASKKLQKGLAEAFVDGTELPQKHILHFSCNITDDIHKLFLPSAHHHAG